MPKNTSSKKYSYQELSLKLDGIVAKLQDSEVAIDQAVKYYEEAMDVIAEMEERLEKAENELQEIRSKFNGDD